MKRLVFSLFFIAWVNVSFAQEAILLAFSKSYEREQYQDYKTAIKHLTDVYQEKSYQMNVRLGWLSYLNKDFVVSTNYYRKAMEISKNSIEARMGYVLPASLLGNWNEVADRYREIVKIDPRNTTANYRLGLIHYNRKEYSSAYEYLNKVLDIYPNDYSSLSLQAWTCVSLGKVEQARNFFTQVLILSPNDIAALKGLSQLK
ncbi:MAG: tetratricopeptide repeat protein [Bacteroidetes bacterium]|nr:MAG: tetratricopeptide repeat protein [Bacteroidota bacterium]